MPKLISYVPLFLLLFSSSIPAQGEGDSIIMEIGTPVASRVSTEGLPGPLGQSRPIDPLHIARMLRNIKAVICGAIQKGKVRVWFKATAGAELLVVSASAEGGIETTIECE